MTFTALEGPGIGHREQLQPDPGGGLCIEPELIKRLPPVPRSILVCLSFHRGALDPRRRGFGRRPRLLHAGSDVWSRASPPSGSQTAVWYCSLSGTEAGQRTDLRGGGGRWAVGHRSPALPAGRVAEGPGPGHHSGRVGTRSSVQKVIPESGSGMGLVLLSVRLQGLVSCCQDLCHSARQPLATCGQFLVTIDRSWKRSSSVALTTFQVLRSHKRLLVASVSGEADVNLSIVTESSVGRCYVDGFLQSLSLDHMADKILCQAKPGTPSPPSAGTLTPSRGPL